jgi:hypothetical protein
LPQRQMVTTQSQQTVGASVLDARQAPIMQRKTQDMPLEFVERVQASAAHRKGIYTRDLRLPKLQYRLPERATRLRSTDGWMSTTKWSLIARRDAEPSPSLVTLITLSCIEQALHKPSMCQPASPYVHRAVYIQFSV